MPLPHPGLPNRIQGQLDHRCPMLVVSQVMQQCQPLPLPRTLSSNMPDLHRLLCKDPP